MTPQGGGAVDAARRNLVRLGVGGTPVLMTLASQPVLGANCLSNALSGNMSDQNRGMCQLGYSISSIAIMGTWGVINPDVVLIEETPLNSLGAFSGETGRTLRDLIVNGSSNQQVYLAAWANAMIKTDYMMTEVQFIDLINGVLPVPGGVPLVSYLASTLAP